MKSSYFLKHASRLAKKHAGKYIAVANNKIVAMGKTRLETYRKAVKKISAKQPLGVYYLPTPQELLSALWISIT